MPILNSASAMQAEIAGWRRQLHAHPEVGFDLDRTAPFVVARLEEAGCDEVVFGVGGTGVVALIKGRLGDGPTIGLRADMDALPIAEEGTQPHASTHPGKMHACGHDGHTAMLLGAAKHLAETRNFAGTAALIFQPAEEIGQGARAMLDDRLLDRFGISRVYGMHNMPGIPVGHFAVRTGAMMAAVAKYTIRIKGRGGHAAHPQDTIDTVVAGAQLVGALQSIVSRNVDPISSVVVTITKVDAGTAFNIIPEVAELWGTTRALTMADAEMAETRIREICAGIGAATGTAIEVDYMQGPPPATNSAEAAAEVAAVARDVAGEAGVDLDPQPVMAGEDFAYMMEERSGAFVFIGNGDSAGLHHPAYDFDDEAIPAGVSYWARLVETVLA
jgi:amidohydrolase